MSRPIARAVMLLAPLLAACGPRAPAAGAAHVATASAEPVPAGPVAIAPVAPHADVLPWQVFDRVEGTCGWQAYHHVEGITLATGAVAWTAPTWTGVIGQLPDGGVVVDNSGFGGVGAYQVAVLDRATGRARFRCETAFPAAGTVVSWHLVGEQLVGLAATLQAPSGTPTRPPPPLPSLGLVMTRVGCDLAPTDAALAAARPLPWSAQPWISGDVTVALLPGDDPAAPVWTLAAARAGAPAWRREVAGRPFTPCKIP